MNVEYRGILYGMLFGDGNLYIAMNNFDIQYCKLTIGHSPKQREYLEHKIDLLHSVLGGKKPKIYSYQSKGYTNLQTVKTNKYFRQMHKLLYPFGSKIYTRQTLDYLTDHGLALWYCDDGNGTTCKNKTGKISGCMTRISTYCSEQEALILREWFEDRYSISPNFDIDKRNNKFSLRFNTKDSHIFIQIVSQYMPKCMSYKTEHIEKYNPRTPSPILIGEDIV